MTVAEVLGGAGLVPVRRGRPLPLHRAGSVRVADGVDLVENEAGGVVVLWGMPTWCWEGGDVVGRRLAAVQLVETGAATRTDVAAGFGVSTDAARCWSRDYERGGAHELGLQAKGPKRASKLTEDKRQEIRAARALDSRSGRGLRGEPQFRVPGFARRRPVACRQRREATARGQRNWCRWPAPSPVPPSARRPGPGCWPGQHRCSATAPACRWPGHCWFRASGNIEVVGNQLHVRIERLSAPRRSRAIAALGDELNETLYPGTRLRLVYSVKSP